jgi:SWI/SNF-related matrix-associated actin-dependent regulator 1 of chromatin subfamily A
MRPASAYEEISDDEWSNHAFKPSRVLKRPQPPPPPIDSFRYDPKAPSATGTSKTAAVVLSSSDDDDFDLRKDVSSRRVDSSSRALKRPQQISPPRWATLPVKPSSRRNPKPSRPAGSSDDDFDPEDDDFDVPASRKSRRRTAGRRLAAATVDLSDDEEDLDLTFEDSDVADDDSDDLPDDDSDRPAPRPSRPRRTAGRRFVVEEDDDSDGSVPAGVVEVEDDGVNWSELENDDDEDGDYSGQKGGKAEEVEGDVVGKALRRCSRISFDLRRELYGSSTRNCESYAETDASTVRIVTQVRLSVLKSGAVYRS